MIRSCLVLLVLSLTTETGAEERSPVLLELFTSEGCSSCPPADAALERLVRSQAVFGAEIIPLALHVDYWNRLGWADPFSSADFSRRQEEYSQAFGGDRVYTPQMVVDGSKEFVGDESGGIKWVAAASKQPKTRMEMELSPRCDRSPGVSLSVAPVSIASSGDVPELFVALTESGLVSNVARGENAGRVLRHTAVVRQLRSLGEINKTASSSRTAKLSVEKDWKKGAIQVVAFVQEKRSRRILGAVARPLCDAAPR